MKSPAAISIRMKSFFCGFFIWWPIFCRNINFSHNQKKQIAFHYIFWEQSWCHNWLLVFHLAFTVIATFSLVISCFTFFGLSVYVYWLLIVKREGERLFMERDYSITWVNLIARSISFILINFKYFVNPHFNLPRPISIKITKTLVLKT